MIDGPRPPAYVEHEGTLRVSGVSKPLQLARHAQQLITDGRDLIEFFYIGANAGQQACKAMTIVTYQLAEESGGKVSACWKPRRVLTTAVDVRTKLPADRDASVWELVLNTL